MQSRRGAWYGHRGRVGPVGDLDGRPASVGRGRGMADDDSGFWHRSKRSYRQRSFVDNVEGNGYEGTGVESVAREVEP
jgi:hypothetical protein